MPCVPPVGHGALPNPVSAIPSLCVFGLCYISASWNGFVTVSHCLTASCFLHVVFTERAHGFRHRRSNPNNPSPPHPPPFCHPASLPPIPSSSRSMCLSCCLWCVCSLTWLDSSCAVREPSWCPVWPAADWWGCYACLCLSGSLCVICRLSVFFLLCGLSPPSVQQCSPTHKKRHASWLLCSQPNNVLSGIQLNHCLFVFYVPFHKWMVLDDTSCLHRFSLNLFVVK